MALNATHDPELRSWVEGANDPATEFPIQNLPFGIFRKKGKNERPRGGVAIGDQIFDLAALGLETGPILNGFAAAGPHAWAEVRKGLSQFLSVKNYRKNLAKHLTPMRQAELFLPVAIGDYTDFYAGIHHATTIGKLFRPDNPLLPNYKWVPIAYHGRASSVVVSGTPVVRPNGQAKPPDAPAPVFGPSRRLDYEVELGFVLGPGNALGKPIQIGEAEKHIFGVVLMNDWSARDLQAWEYQPLGPFLAKSFATTISPWIVTLEALEPFRSAPFEREPGDPRPLAYLSHEKDRGVDIALEMHLRTAAMKKPVRLSRGNARDAYWTPAQMVAHHASNGCNLRPGDLLGSGTLSGTTPGSLGSLMELTSGGRTAIELSGGQKRMFLEDGDEAILRGRCERDGAASIGFAEARGRVLPARPAR
ncbi:MAG: fumarylacetoacetase [Betaproteobacteria bacterium]|nr:fumarylacetoacetase [Betaproteobacteria bacterium]